MFVAAVLADVSVRLNVEFGMSGMPFLFDFAVLSGISLILILFNRKVRNIIELVIVIVTAAYCFSMTMHYEFFDTFFTLKKLTVASELVSVLPEVPTKLHIKQLLFVLPIVMMTACVVIDKRHEETVKRRKLFVVMMTVVLSASLSLIYVKLKSQKGDWNSDKYLLKNCQNKNRYFSRFGVYTYAVYDIKNIIEKDPAAQLSDEEYQELEQFVENHNDSCDNDMTGIYEGKNLVLVLAESFSKYAISEELTPTLYNIASNATNFDNYYAPLYLSATGDSENISQTSMFPSVDYGTTSYTFYDNSFPYSLANLFKEKGYEPNSYHSYVTNFYNRELFHESLGFNTFYDIDKLGMEFGEYYQHGINWPYDEELFRSVVGHTNTDGTFYDFVITTSGHMPYDKSRDEFYGNLKLIENSSYADLDLEAKCYLAAQMNFDKGMEALLEELDNRGVLEDTIIVIFGDHYPYGIEGEESYKEVIGETGYKKYKAPFIIYDPSNPEYQVIDTLCSTFDIYPTICNLFNLDNSKAFMVGKDAFEEDGHTVYFMDRSILTDDFYYEAIEGSVEVLSEHYEDEDFSEAFKEAEDMFKYGQEILTSNYFGKDE